MMLPGGVAMNSVQFEMESRTGAQRAFVVKSFYKNSNSYVAAQCEWLVHSMLVVKSFYKNSDSYVAAQREFHKKFRIHRNSEVPSAHAIKTWVNKFEETGSTVKKKGGSVKTVRTPQNIDVVRASFEQSPCWSVVRHSKKLGLSESSVRCILHLDLHCGYRKRFQESRSTCYLGPWVVFMISLPSVSSVRESILRM